MHKKAIKFCRVDQTDCALYIKVNRSSFLSCQQIRGREYVRVEPLLPCDRSITKNNLIQTKWRRRQMHAYMHIWECYVRVYVGEGWKCQTLTVSENQFWSNPERVRIREVRTKPERVSETKCATILQNLCQKSEMSNRNVSEIFESRRCQNLLKPESVSHYLQILTLSGLV